MKRKTKHKEMNIHHRAPKCMGNREFLADGTPNTCLVNKRQHEHYHGLVGHGGDVYETAKILNEFIDPRYKFVVVKIINT